MKNTFLYLKKIYQSKNTKKHKILIYKLGSNFTNFANNSFWLFSEKVLRIIVELWLSIWLARHLGAKDFGLFNFSIAFVDLFAPLFHLGLPNIVVRELVTKSDSQNQILGTTFVLKLFGGIIVLCMATILSIKLRPEDTLSHSLVAIIATGKIFKSFETLDFWFQSQMQSKYIAISKSIAFSIASIAKIILIFFNAPLTAFALITTLEIFLIALGFIVSYLKSGFSLTSWKPSFVYAKKITYECFPSLLTTAAMVIQIRIDQVMLGQMVGEVEVGQYSVAMRLIEAFTFVPTILCQSLFPILVRIKSQDEAAYIKCLTNTYRLMFITFVFATIPILLFSKAIVLNMYGQEYQIASNLLPLFSIRLFFNNMGIARRVFIVNDSLFGFSLFSAVSGTLINITFNLVLIPKFASLGALWATIISFSGSIFILDLFYSKMHRNSVAMIKGIFTPLKLDLKL